MHTLTAEDMFNYDGTIAVCPLCKGKRVIVTERLGASFSPLLPAYVAAQVPSNGRNVETTFLHAPTCEARIKAFR